MIQRLAIGLAAGLGGACAGHWGVIAAHWLTGDANIWLKGPHGPPFFDLSLSTGLFFAVIGAGILGQRTLKGTRAGWAAFGFLAAPMTAATYIFTWGEDPGQPETLAWLNLVVSLYALANAGGASLAGWLAAGTRGGLGALAGAAAAAMVQYGLAFKFASSILTFGGYLPPPFQIFSGALWGAFIVLGVELARKKVGSATAPAAIDNKKEAEYA